jgi:hypothetical protein
LILALKEILMIYARSLLSMLFVVALLAAAASAQVRTFVASTGSDANPCSRAAPCRTFQAAVNAVAAGGEVVALDSAGFGSSVSITKAVSIIASPGVYAGITVSSGDGVDVNAGATDAVALRGLTVINQGSAGIGIAFSTGGSLTVANCVVNGFDSGAGVSFQPSGSSSLKVKDSIMRANGGGIAVAGSAQAFIEQVRLERGVHGLFVGHGAIVTVRNSVASANATGFYVSSDSSASSELNIENCIASDNSSSGVRAITTSTGIATVRVSNSTVTNNPVGLHNLGPLSVILSRDNNTIEGNVNDTLGTIGSYTPR